MATLRKPRNAIPRSRIGLGSSQMRNFKTDASGCDFGNVFRDWSLVTHDLPRSEKRS